MRPTPTPDPHLDAPASVDIVLARLNAMGLAVRANNASRPPDGEPLKRVNATFASWPLAISEYSSAEKLREALDAPASPPVGGDPPGRSAPVLLVGMNILIEYGPSAKGAAPSPDAGFIAAAAELADALEPLLGPLENHSSPLSAASSAAP